MDKNTDIKALAANTKSVYEHYGLSYDAERSKILFERAWLRRFEAYLPEQAAILDVGCGAGEPIARYFIQNGHEVTGIDFSESLIALAKQRFPNHRWQVADMRTIDLPRQFDGIIGWHSFFHLTPAEQRSTLERFAGHLLPEGVLLVTVGPEENETIGQVGGQPVYHSSLSLEAYREILHRLGMTIIDFVAEDPECDFATILLAQKSIPRQLPVS